MGAMRRYGTAAMRGLALCGWACGVFTVLAPDVFESIGDVREWGVRLLAAMALIHCAEIPIGVRIGGRCGVSPPRSALMTAVFGFTWWLPVKWEC